MKPNSSVTLSFGLNLSVTEFQHCFKLNIIQRIKSPTLHVLIIGYRPLFQQPLFRQNASEKAQLTLTLTLTRTLTLTLAQTLTLTITLTLTLTLTVALTLLYMY